MDNILSEPLSIYLSERNTPFGGNQFAWRFRNEYPKMIREVIVDQDRFKVLASTGKGNWTECPWIAILDLLITDSPQSGYYPVLIFKADMSGVYLTLNQGITEVKENYKSEAKRVLKLRAVNFRAILGLEDSKYLKEIDLASNTSNARFYEAGNIIANYYPVNSLPSIDELKADLLEYLKYYDQLIYSDSSLVNEKNTTTFENKKLRLHWRIERNSSISKKVKALKGYTCEACGFTFTSMYGELGQEFIEAHHLKPISKLELGKTKIDLENDFAVLCSNCHRMIHKLPDPSDLNKLKEIIKRD